jgi:hypothetical protein
VRIVGWRRDGAAGSERRGTERDSAEKPTARGSRHVLHHICVSPVFCLNTSL